MLLSGLLSTICASALLTTMCTPETEGTATGSITGMTCTPLQAADALVWTVSTIFELMSAGLASSNVISVAILDTDEACREWWLRHWNKVSLSYSLALNTNCWLVPAAFAVRSWLLTSTPVAIATSTLFALFSLGIYGLSFNLNIWVALEIAMGQKLSFKEYDKISETFHGPERCKSLNFAKAAAGVGASPRAAEVR